MDAGRKTMDTVGMRIVQEKKAAMVDATLSTDESVGLPA